MDELIAGITNYGKDDFGPTSPPTVWSLVLAFVLLRFANAPERRPLAGRQAEGKNAPASDRAIPGHRDRAADESRARQGGRGRDARSPTDIPKRGWKDIFWRVIDGMNEHRLLAVAGGVTYFGLL